MTTLSQLVDELIRETKRADLVNEIVTYVNQTTRELHAEPERGNIVYYAENFKETQIIATIDSGQTWTAPKPGRFQGMAMVQFGSSWVDGQNPYAQATKPGPILHSLGHYYYRTGSTFVFGGQVGYGGVGGVINLGYYEYPRSLRYYMPDERPAVWDLNTESYTYLPEYDVDELTRATARDLSTHWLLERWSDVLKEGVRAKVYKRLADTERGRTSYSMYESLRKAVYTNEATHLAGVT